MSGLFLNVSDVRNKRTKSFYSECVKLLDKTSQSSRNQTTTFSVPAVVDKQLMKLIEEKA